MTPLKILDAPAKLNLFLHILGKRADGYHLLDSLVGFTEFGDRLEVRPADKDLSLEVTGPFADQLLGEGNLVLRAAELLRQHFNVSHGATIHLHKHIPIGGGLGGGSTDAAMALKGLVQMWGLKVPQEEWVRLGSELGSDVPVCIAQKAARISGVGEEVTPIQLNVTPWLVLVNPRKPLLTAEVFKAFNGPSDAKAPLPDSIDSLDTLIEILQCRRNVLEKAATGLLPEVGDILHALRSTPGCRLARMSGSGATCFGIYARWEEAGAAMRTMEAEQPGWWYEVTRLQMSR